MPVCRALNIFAVALAATFAFGARSSDGGGGGSVSASGGGSGFVSGGGASGGGVVSGSHGGGSSGARVRLWKAELQYLADEMGLRLHVRHFPPGTSKWNRVEHRLFCHITENWRGKSLRTFETVVRLIGHTSTATGLRVKAKLDKRKYPTGTVVADAEMQRLALHPKEFHGEWNYELRPRAIVER